MEPDKFANCAKNEEGDPILYEGEGVRVLWTPLGGIVVEDLSSDAVLRIRKHSGTEGGLECQTEGNTLEPITMDGFPGYRVKTLEQSRR